ncbi:MAG TPA: polyprenyl diphosphate synthase [Fervidobacterium sp.]|nr:polyprenyl diphosphate synthase [Fervidobacterium sp.]HOQ39996.1 polyprenyl diphosphate synthase [Fervidobacterium sp.]HPP18044.1 polyprenyl diphosphate synthase [Fervidobacterium sp.]HPT54482.1 polyprenyl diphosphate synthase [Fervidobacterium sp.]HPZ17583.1 polyprenyl diphosphate synthase [Fervidobacterium sp.]
MFEKVQKKQANSNKLRHIAFIMDGNGRWAKKQGKPRTYGHYVGAYKIEDVVKWCADRGVEYTTFYAFSTENWKRPPEEVGFIFNLLTEKIGEFYDRMNKEKVRLRFIGRIEELPENVKAKCIEYEEKTKNNNKIQAILAFNYGGRSEIVDAVKKIIDSGISSIDEQTFRNYLYAPDIPDPDLVIRTSGEMRISNFLLWEIAYSELYFSKLLWPEFSEEELEKSIKAYQVRERRFGGIR